MEGKVDRLGVDHSRVVITLLSPIGCHLKSHRDHLEADDKLQPCVHSERKVKRLLALAPGDEERDFWVEQLAKITLVRGDEPQPRPQSPL